MIIKVHECDALDSKQKQAKVMKDQDRNDYGKMKSKSSATV